MTMTDPTPDLTGLPQEIQESFQAGRIDSSHAIALKYINTKEGTKEALNALSYFEKKHFVREYLEIHGFEFKLHGFAYELKLPNSEKQKIAVVLKQALEIAEYDLEKEAHK